MNFTRQLYEYAAVVVEVRQEERVRPVVVGPGAANICANIEPGPTEHRGRRRGLDGEISRMRSERTKSIAALATYLRRRFIKSTLD